MAIRYKQCPQCGSSKVLDIMYGMPTMEAFEMYERGEIKLGGCCITGEDPQYYCRECENEWAREAAIKHAYREIRGIKAIIHNDFQSVIEITIDFENGHAKWIHHVSDEKSVGEQRLTPKQQEVIRKEFKRVKMLNWKAKYVNADLSDGPQWQLEIIRTGRTLKKWGDNAGPTQWAAFYNVITQVSGKGLD